MALPKGQVAGILLAKAKPAGEAGGSPDEAAMRAFMDALKADDAAAALVAWRDLDGGEGGEGGDGDAEKGG